MTSDFRDLPPFFQTMGQVLIVAIQQEFQHFERKIMGAVEDLKATEGDLSDAVQALVLEQAHFLSDMSTRLEGDNPDIPGVTADLKNQVAQLRSLVEQQQAADPGDGTSTPAPTTTDETSTPSTTNEASTPTTTDPETTTEVPEQAPSSDQTAA